MNTEEAYSPKGLREPDFLIEKYDVSIETLDYGYKVRVGCKSFAITSTEILVNMLTKYLNNPGEVQQQFYQGKLEIN
jgi:hypothetical protein